jgi:hypothetical protein
MVWRSAARLKAGQDVVAWVLCAAEAVHEFSVARRVLLCMGFEQPFWFQPLLQAVRVVLP